MSATYTYTKQFGNIFLLALLAISCDGAYMVDPDAVEPDPDEPTPSHVRLDSIVGSLTEGDTVVLRAELVDTGGEPIPEATLTWASSDENVLSIWSTGATEASMEGVGPGTAAITVAYEESSVTADVEVHPRPVDLVYRAGADQQADAGSELPDSAVVFAVDRRGDPVSEVEIEFEIVAGGGSAAPAAAVTDGAGLARTSWTLGASGAQVMHAHASPDQPRLKNMKDSLVVFNASIAETDPVVVDLDVSPRSVTVEPDDTVAYQATATYSNGDAGSDANVSWESTDSEVATITDGLLRALNPGTARVVARTTADGQTIADTAEVIVAAPDPAIAGIRVQPEAVTMDAGTTQQFDATAIMSDGTEQSATVAWSTTGGTIESNGVYTAGDEAGTFHIVGAHQDGFADTATVTVRVQPDPDPTVTGIEVRPGSAELDPDATHTFEAVAHMSDDSEQPATVSWSATGGTIGSDGLYTAGNQGGTFQVVGTHQDGFADTATVIITVPEPNEGTLAISPATDTLQGIGATLELNVEARDAAGSVITDAEVQWASSNPDIARVDDMGRLTAEAIGTALITATAVCCSPDSGTYIVAPEVPGTVDDLTVLDVTTGSVTLEWTQVDDGTGSPARYALRYGSPTISWGGSYETEETADGNAIGGPLTHTFEGLEPGTNYQFQLISYRGTLNQDATFGAQSNIASAGTEAGEPLEVVSVTVSPTNPIFTTIGQTRQLTATGYDSEGNVVNGAEFSYESSDPSIISVDNMGRMTANAVGTAAIVVASLCCDAQATANGEVDPDAPAGEPFFEDGFESGDLSHTQNGGRWAGTTGVSVSSLLARSGSNSLRFAFAGTSSGSDAWAEAHYWLGREVTEWWWDMWMYFPDGTEDDGAGGTLNAYVHRSDSPSNNKITRFWGGTDPNDHDSNRDRRNTFGASMWAGGGGDSNINPDVSFPSSTPGPPPGGWPNAPFIHGPDDRGRWIQVRMHFLAPSADGRADGRVRAWKDGVLLYDDSSFSTWDDAVPYWDRGELMGWANSGFDQDTYVFIDDLKFYDEDPGWDH